MMAKKLQRSATGSETKRTYPVGKVVATTGGKTKQVAKVKVKVVPAKKPFPPFTNKKVVKK